MRISTGWGGLISPPYSYTFTIFEKFRVLFSKTNLNDQNMEYSTISMLDYFEHTLVNVGLHEARLNRTRIIWPE